MQSVIRKENLKTGLAENYINISWPAPLMPRCHFQQDAVKIHPNSTLLMIGDSITDCGRVSPAAETVRDSLGYGYVKLIHNMLAATCPRQHIRILNRGISGNTVRNLAARWQSDVLDLKPDWLSILIGINDVWPKFDACQPVCLHIGAPDQHNAVSTKRNSAHDTLLYRTQSGGAHAGNDGPVWGCGAPVGRAVSNHTGRYSGGVRICLDGSSSGGAGFGPGASETGRAHDSGTGFFKGSGYN
jgi:hypothetical protein